MTAHALDELRGRPLKTELPSAVLWAAAIIGLAAAVGVGLAAVPIVGWGLLPFIAAGVLFVFAYNLELLGGRLHGDFWFALSWGAFPVVTAYFAQTGRLSIGAIAVAAEVIKVRVPANNAISTGTRALLFICIPSLSSTALVASTFFPANQHATGRSVSVEMPAYTKR